MEKLALLAVLFVAMVMLDVFPFNTIFRKEEKIPKEIKPEEPKEKGQRT